jgi:hypothetical protein
MLLAKEREFQFELNAFLSAARSVSFVLQKAMTSVPGFDQWYGQQQQRMKEDAEMRFFLDLRNISQKQGPVSYISGGNMTAGKMSPLSYRFVASCTADVPPTLRDRDIARCCASHLSKLASLVYDCAQAFRFHACPGQALTEEGMNALGYALADVEIALGLPTGYAQVGTIPLSERLRLLSREFYVLEREEIERIAAGEFRRGETPLEFPAASDGRSLLDYMAAIINEGGESSGSGREVFVRAATKRLADLSDRSE